MKATILTLLLAFSFAGCYTQLAVTSNEEDELQRGRETPPIVIVLPPPPPPIVMIESPLPAASAGPVVRTFGSTRVESNRSQSDNGGRRVAR